MARPDTFSAEKAGRAALSLKWLKMVSIPFSCLLASDLGLFGEQLLAVLKDVNSRGSNESERKQSLSINR
jgi:hypothetical protein